MPRPSVDALLGPPPVDHVLGPAPARPKAPAAKPVEQPGILSRAWTDVKNMGSGLIDSIEGMPQARDKARVALRKEYATTPTDLSRIALRAPGAVQRNVIDPAKELVADIKKPLDRSKGWLARPARYGKVGLDAANTVFGAPAAAISTAVGPEVEALTGINKDTFGNLATMLIPGAGVAKLATTAAKDAGALGKGAKFASALEKDVNKALPSAGKTAKAATGAPVLRERKGVLGGLQRTFAPETVSERARDTATLHRAAHGVRRGEAAAENYALERHQRVVGNAPPEQQRELANYVDTRSTAKPLSNPKLQPAADAMRGVAQRYRARIENVLSDDTGGGPSFVTDYYARMWKNSPKEVEDALANRRSVVGGKQGSGRNLKARSIPTYQEGLDAGLKPMFENPLDAMNAYTDNMASFLATHDVQNAMKSNGLAKWAFEGSIPKGFTKLEGIRTVKPAMQTKDGALIPQRVLVAPDDAARVYNRTVSKGLDQGSFGPVYRGARAASNAVSQMKLGLSAFHATVMGEEGMVSAFAKGLNQALRGDVVGGAKAMAASPTAAYRTAAKGGALRRAILEPDKAITKGLDPRLVSLYQRAGGRVGMDRFYSTGSVSGGFWRGFKNGTFTREVGDALKRIGKEPVRGSLDLVGKTLDTVSAPIFKEYVPRMKAGAWASRMEQWLKDHPEASPKETQRYAENLVNNMDNRFGELIMDNQFWDKAHFQIAQLLMLSPSWNFGTVREIGGGLAELPKSVRMAIKGKGVTDKTAYVGALATTFMLQNGIATYLHTGQMPEGQDWLAYRTGGTDKDGVPERGLIPGYMKDVLAFAWDFPHNVVGEVENKANPALTLAAGLVTNKDYYGNPIYRPPHDTSDPEGSRIAEAGKYTAEQMAPISMSQPGRGPDTGFTKPETFLGVRKAPAYLENPDKKISDAEKYDTLAWKKKTRRDAKQEQQQAQGAPKPNVDSLLGPPRVEDILGAGPAGPRTKPGAGNAGDLRPEMKPILSLLPSVPGFNRVTAENDSYHPARDVHGQGRAIDFTVTGSSSAAAAHLRRKLAEAGIKAKVVDEYANPSRRATGGHIHVQLG